jgi:hypothetical protein
MSSIQNTKSGDSILKLKAIIGILVTLRKYHLMLQPVIFIFVLLFVGVVQAKNIPSKTIQVIITCPLVGGSEFMTRVVGQKLEELWIRPVVIEVEKIKHA